jgi:hypothetical protein
VLVRAGTPPHATLVDRHARQMMQAEETFADEDEEAQKKGFARSRILGTFLAPGLERDYVTMLCEQWRYRIRASYCVLSLHFVLMSMATAFKWLSYPFQLVGTLPHNGTLVSVHDLAPGTGIQNVLLPLFSIGFTLAAFSPKLYRPATFRWLIAGFILSAIIWAYVPQTFGYLSIQTFMSPPILDNIARPACPFVASADATCAAQWSAWHGRLPRTIRVREEAASWYMAVTAMYFVMIAALPLPYFASLAFCVLLGVVSWTEASMAIKVVYGDQISYTPFTQLTVLSVAVIYIARIREKSDRQAFVSQHLLVAKNAERVERLTQSKERADYDRAIAEKSLARLEQATAPGVAAAEMEHAPSAGNGVLMQHGGRSFAAHALPDGSSSATESELGEIIQSMPRTYTNSNHSKSVSSEAASSESSSVMLSTTLKVRLQQTLSDMDLSLSGADDKATSKNASSGGSDWRAPWQSKEETDHGRV